MSNIDPNANRTAFFPKARGTKSQPNKGVNSKSEKVSKEGQKASPLAQTPERAKVDIKEAIRDYSKIKKAAIKAPEFDVNEKIAMLKGQIKSGEYEIDYDAVADEMLRRGF